MRSRNIRVVYASGCCTIAGKGLGAKIVRSLTAQLQHRFLQHALFKHRKVPTVSAQLARLSRTGRLVRELREKYGVERKQTAEGAEGRREGTPKSTKDTT